MENGKFVISLDFEIYWGMRNVVKLEKYKDNVMANLLNSVMALQNFTQNLMNKF